jgi:hypothetical protein
MALKLTQDEKKFLSKGLLANGIAWLVGIILAIVLSYTVVNLFYPKETNLIVGICLGAVVGYSQWLVLKKYFKPGVWWILAAAIGIGLPFVVIFVLYEINGVEVEFTGMEILDQAILLFMGGFLTGLLQFNIFKALSPKYAWWIIISTFAWGIGWFGLILGGLVLGLIAGFPILRLFSLPIQNVPGKRA